MNYLLIGGSGFIGTHLTQHLLQQGDTVYNVDPHIPIFNENSQYHWHPNLITEEFINKAETILYLASKSHVRSSQNSVDMEIDNLTSFIRFLEQAKDRDKRIILFSSGGHVYGENPQNPISEEHCTQPVSPYGITKNTMEQYLKYYSDKYDFNYNILRLGNVYGPGQNTSAGVGLVTTLLYNYHHNITTPLVGNIDSVVRDYIYVDDVVSAINRILGNEYTLNRTFNVSSGVGYSIRDILSIISKVCGYKPDLRLDSMGDDKVSKIILNTEKLTTYTGWVAETGIEEGIRLTDQHIRENLE